MNPSAGAPDPAQKPSKRILVVDDNINTRIILRDILTFEGYSVEIAPDGVEAIRKVVAARPDLVILDLDMPRLDGRSVVKLLRENAGPGRLPILILSGSDAENLEEEMARLGADGFVRKGRDISILVARVGALLGRAP